MAIGKQRMSEVNVPSFPTGTSGAPSKGESLAAGISNLLGTAASLYGNVQKQQAAADEQAALADVELQLIDTEEQASRQSDLFRQTAQVQQMADTDGDGQVSEEEAEALKGFESFKSRIRDNVFDPNRANSMLRRKKRELIAQYPSLAEHIVDRAAKAQELVQAETQLFSSNEELQNFQDIYGVGPINGLDYQKFRANRAYLASKKTQGAVTLNNLKSSASAEINVGLTEAMEGFRTTFRENPQAMKDPTEFMNMIDSAESSLLRQITNLNTRAADSEVPIPADELNTFITQQQDKIRGVFDRIRESKEPTKVLGNVTKMNEMIIQSGMQDVAPQAMALAGQDPTNKTLENLVNITLNGGPQASTKLKAALELLPGEYDKNEMMALIDFHSRLQDPEMRRQLLVQNPYKAGAISAQDMSNGSTDAADTEVQSMNELLNSNKDRELSILSEAVAGSEGAMRTLAEAPSATKLKWQSHIEARVKRLAQNLQGGEGDAPGAVVEMEDGQPVVKVFSISGGGQQQKILKYTDRQATKNLQSAMTIYNRGGLGDGQQLLDIFNPPEQEGTDLPVVEAGEQEQTESQPTASPMSNALEELEDVAMRSGERLSRIQRKQVADIAQRANITPEQAESLVQRLKNDEDFETILKEMSATN